MKYGTFCGPFALGPFQSTFFDVGEPLSDLRRWPRDFKLASDAMRFEAMAAEFGVDLGGARLISIDGQIAF